MKKLFSILAVSSMLVIAGCSGDEGGAEEGADETANVNVSWNVQEGAELAVADISIKGMSCQINCVSKVDASLDELDGVTKIEMDFESDREIDHAMVTFDPTRITQNELIHAVTGIADGAYSVTDMSVEGVQNGASSNEDPAEGETVELNDNTSLKVSFPNVIELFYSLF